jgi:hypothetical protein
MNISFPALIRIADDKIDSSGAFRSGLRAAHSAKLADWLAAARHQQPDHILRNIQRVIELARSQDVDPERPLIPQIQVTL